MLSAAAFARAPIPEVQQQTDVVASLIGTLVDVVGVRAKNRGRSCPQHDCCGNQVERGMKVKVLKEKMKYRGDNEDDVLVVYLISGRVVGCKVGFLGQHLATTRADDYDGIILHIIEVYTDRCTSVVKHNKMHQNEGCCVGKVRGDRKCLEF